MLLHALPFLISFTMVPLVLVAAILGGWWIALPFIWGWVMISVLDRVKGLNTDNLDPATKDSVLLWHKLVTWTWVPTQIAMILFVLWQITLPGHLSTAEAVLVALALGTATGGIGITYAHEMVHQRNRWERWAGELLLASVAYGHFATEHVYGHHIHVATPKDPVSARKGESFFSFFPRAVVGTFVSAWKIDTARLAKRALPVWHHTNPFWRYAIGAGLFLGFSWWLAGAWGLLLFALQAYQAVYQLEAVNYVEHYGLVRKHLGGGRYEHAKPRHSWNSSHALTNLLLINLQRHSDHHYKPDRRYPLLQTYDEDEAPQLPYGYPAMIVLSFLPPVWFWLMNPRVRAWRKRFYPEVTDWNPYRRGLTPTPR